jgi:hypothetical protein
MSGDYSVPCQRCGVRSAKKMRAEPRAAQLFSAASQGFAGVKLPSEVRLCGSCERTVKSLGYAIYKANRRPRKKIEL